MLAPSVKKRWKLILNIEFIFRHQKDFWLTWHARGIYILAHNQRNYYGGRNIKTEIYWKISSLIFSLRIKIIIIFISFSLLVEKNFKENFISSIKRINVFPCIWTEQWKNPLALMGRQEQNWCATFREVKRKVSICNTAVKMNSASCICFYLKADANVWNLQNYPQQLPYVFKTDAWLAVKT